MEPARRASRPCPSPRPRRRRDRRERAAGGCTLVDVRRLWPDIVDATKLKRRVTWILLTQNAQVVAVDAKTLTLGFVNAGARDSFVNGGSDEIVRQAAIDVVGVDWRVEAIVDPSARPDAGAAGSPTRRCTGRPSGAAAGARAGAAPGAGPTAPPPRGRQRRPRRDRADPVRRTEAPEQGGDRQRPTPTPTATTSTSSHRRWPAPSCSSASSARR